MDVRTNVLNSESFFRVEYPKSSTAEDVIRDRVNNILLQTARPKTQKHQ